MKNIQKSKKNLLLFGGGGGNSKLGGEGGKGEISPPKGPEKTLFLS